MPSKLDPHVATIEDWLAAEPQLTALAIVCRLSGSHPEQFGTRQHSIVQRLLEALRKKAAEKLIAQEPLCPATTVAPLPGAVDGSGYGWPDPPTAPPVEQALEVDERSTDWFSRIDSADSATRVTFADEAIRGVKIGRRSLPKKFTNFANASTACTRIRVGSMLEADSQPSRTA